MSLPLDSFEYYVGVDPGAKGAFGLMNARGTIVQSSTMPITDGELDNDGLRAIFKHLARLPKVYVGIEWPTAWPGSFANNPRDADFFGQQKAKLEAFAYCHNLAFGRIPPQVWKGRLGLDGKTIVGANDRAAGLWDTFYPEHASLIRGPRGGLLDGKMDALLIAHMLRTRDSQGMRSIVDKFGKDSVEAFAFIMGGGRRKRKFGKRICP